MRKIILASTSPRRKEIFEKTGLPFVIEDSGYEEDMTLPMSPQELAKHLALGKAEAVAVRHEDAIVISADTFAVYEGSVIGKPRTKDHAREILTMLSGKWHVFITGFAIVDTKTQKRLVQMNEARVHFRDIEPQELEWYLETGEFLDAAGAYKIQGRAGLFIDAIEGDYQNVMGLPLADVMVALKRFKVHIG